MSGFIIGFDNESPGAGRRIRDFMMETGIPQGQFSMLQALKNTAMWNRLQQEGRLIQGQGTFHQGNLMNFIPTRPVEEIAEEYIEAFWTIYDPMAYLKRTFDHFIHMNGWRGRSNRKLDWQEWRLFRAILWRQGLLRSTRFRFWWQLLLIGLRKPMLMEEYLSTLGIGEHFFSYRHVVRQQLEEQLETIKQSKAEQADSGAPTVANSPQTVLKA